MEKKSVQPRNISLRRNTGGHDSGKKYSQKSSRKGDLKRNGSWSPVIKHQLADNRFQSKVSKEKTMKYQDAQLLQEADGKGLKDFARQKSKEFADIQDDEDWNGDYGRLLNFKFAPRRYHVGSDVSRHGKWTKSARSPVYSKEVYLQASCQFVVRKDGDYRLHAMDPDVMVNWNSIEQVCISSHEMMSCPICLETPTAAKITRCGHVYCWACILHYLRLSDKPWRKCPICYESIVAADLKSAVATFHHKFAKGENITMRLMKRKKGSMLSWPVSCHNSEEGSFAEWTGYSTKSFSKLLMSSPENVLNDIIAQEKKELEKQLANAVLEKTGEECFIECALLKLKEKEKEIMDEIKSNDSYNKFKGSENQALIQEIPAAELCKEEIEAKIGALSVEEPESAPQVDDNEGESDCDENISIQSEVHSPDNESPESELLNLTYEGETKVKPQVSDSYYFYQAEDGQNIFIQPINVRCLVREYGCLENCPETISAQINDMEFYTMTKDLRKRYRYLNHLPVSSSFSLCELILKPPVVSREILSEFSKEFHARKMLRQKKKREERKQEEKMERKKTMDVFGREIKKPGEEISWDLENYEEFPTQFNEKGVDFPTLATTPTNSSSWGSSTFSKALQAKKPPSQAVATVRSRISFESLARDTEKKIDSDGEVDEDYIPVPSFARAFSDALSATLEVACAKKEETPSAPAKRGKKKQKEKKLLFSTGGFMKY